MRTWRVLLKTFVSFMGLGICALAQDPVKTFPKNYSIAFENASVAVIKVHYGPHETIGVHDHPKTPTIYVYLNDSGRVRYQHVGGGAFSVVRPPTTKGSYRVSPGRLESHSIVNLGDTSSDFLRVELKQLPLGGIPHFRGTAPTRLLQSSNTIEIGDDKGFEVRRIICVGAAPCPLDASSQPSLLVAFSPISITDRKPGSTPKTIGDGDIQWFEAAQSGTVIAASTVPAHLLRILIPNPR